MMKAVWYCSWSYHIIFRHTFVHPGKLVFQDGELVNFSELLEQRTQMFLAEVSRDLTDEQFDTSVYVGSRRRRITRRFGSRGANRHAVLMQPVRRRRRYEHFIVVKAFRVVRGPQTVPEADESRFNYAV